MKRVLLLIVVPALLVAMGFAQTPPASSTTDQASIKGCLGGSDGNYTVVEDKTGHIFKITTSSVDLKAHVAHDVTLTGTRASSAAAANSFAVTELSMISEHCAAPAVAPAGTISTLPETAVPPPDAAAIPAATVSAPAETAAAPPSAAPVATVSTPPETAIAPTVAPTPPAETVVTTPAVATTPAATVSTHAEIATTPPAPAARPTRLPPPPQRRPATPAAAATKPAVTASPSPDPVITPDATTTTPAATATTSPETDGTPAAAVIPPAAPARRGSLWILIAFAVVIVVLGILAPSISRWRKRRQLAQTGEQNLSFNREESSADQTKSEQPAPRKVA